MMTPRERILAVFRGETPDVVPFMLDLSHWFCQRERRPWDLSTAYETPDTALIACHRRTGAGFYLPNLAAFYTTRYPPDVQATVTKRDTAQGPEIAWRLETPLGAIERRRIWEQTSYSWAINHWGIATEDDLRVFAYALRDRRFEPLWDRYRAWDAEVGDAGVVYLPLGYSAMGNLLNLWMGVERTIYATADCPALLEQVVAEVNASALRLVDLAATSPAPVVLLGDNFSSDVQPPAFFRRWSAPFYVEAVRRLHAAGKAVAVHIDGRLRGALGMIRDTGADAGDAITPAPLGDLTPAECRAEAGPDFILSGGVSPDLWLPTASDGAFCAAVRAWLDLRRHSPRLLAGAGDQVPPGALPERIGMMRDLVETYGRY